MYISYIIYITYVYYDCKLTYSKFLKKNQVEFSTHRPKSNQNKGISDISNKNKKQVSQKSKNQVLYTIYLLIILQSNVIKSKHFFKKIYQVNLKRMYQYVVWANSTSFYAFCMHSIGNLFVFFIYKPLKNYVISSGQANMRVFQVYNE